MSTLINELLNNSTCAGIHDSGERAKDILRNRFSNLSGELAVDRIIDVWEKVAIDKGLHNSSLEELLDIKKRKRISLQFFKNVYSIIKKLVPEGQRSINKSNKLLDSSHKFSSLTEEEMIEITKNLKMTLRRFQNVHLRTFGDKTFLFYSGN